MKNGSPFNGNPIFHQIVICTRNMHFWQMRRKSCVKRRKSLISTLEMDQKTEKEIKKMITKSCSCDKKRNFLDSAQKVSSIVKLFLNLSPKMKKQSILFTKIVFCSKMTLCTSRMQLWRLFTTFPPETWHIFLLKNQKWLEKLFYKSYFATKFQHFFVKFKCYGKNVTLFSGNPIFHQIIACEGKMQFWQLWPHNCAKIVDLLISTNLKWWKNFQLFENIMKIVHRRRIMQFLQEVCKKVSNSQIIFSIKSKKKENKSFLLRILSVFQKCSFVQI